MERDVALARVVVDELFTNGAGEQAERLVLMTREGRDLGGWGKGPARDRIVMILQKLRGER